MLVANPIYDVVFKYLLDDNRIAKLLISTIINKEVVDLQLRPTEQKTAIKENLTVLRIDFSAKITEADGSQKLVIIEIQKAKLATDIMRFRRYLGNQYSNPDNLIDNEENKQALPIVSIYFLGHQLDKIHSPVIRVERKYFDAITNEELIERENFIESLTHDSYVIQIPNLSDKRRNELEILLSLFDQNNKSSANWHCINIDEEQYPEKYRIVIRRLMKAISEPQIQVNMEFEDDIIEDLKSLERKIETRDKVIEEKEKEIEQKEKTIEEKDRIINELLSKLSNEQK